MIGLSVCAAMSLTIASVKLPADGRRADQHGRPHAVHHLGQGRCRFHSLRASSRAASPRGPRVGRLIVVQLIGHVGGEQSLPVHAPEAPGCILSGKTLAHHGVANLVGDSNARRTGSEDDHALVAQRRPADADGGDGRRQRDRAGALHVVVEGADAVAVLLEDAPSIARREVFPLQQRSGNSLSRLST